MFIIFGVSILVINNVRNEIHCLNILGYKNLEVRTQTREAAWMSPGWDECVAYTVPLIKEMQTKILHPTPFSPTQ